MSGFTFCFEKAALKHEKLIFQWLEEAHMKEFWDNSQNHKDDISNFIHGREQHYFYGTTQYWIGYLDDQPFSFILSDVILSSQPDTTDLMKEYLSKHGKTIVLDFGIGRSEFIGKGLAAPTLRAFMKFYHQQVDQLADTFFIDPDENNPRAFHVYEKAGFKLVGNFKAQKGFFIGQQSHLMVMNLSSHK